MTESVDRLGVDVEVLGFSSFEDHMKRVNEILREFAEMAPTLKKAGSDVGATLERIKKSLGGAGLADGIQKESNTAQAAINKMAVSSAEALNTTTQEVKELRQELKDLQAQNAALAAKPIVPAGPDISALKSQLKEQVGASRRVIEDVLREADARLSTMSGNQQAAQTFENLRARLGVLDESLQSLGRKRTIIDPSMIDQAEDMGKRVTKMADQYQRDFDRIAKAQTSNTGKAAQNVERDMEMAIKRVERALERAQSNISSRVKTSTMEPTAKLEFSRDANMRLDEYKKKLDEVRNTGVVTPESIAQTNQLAKAVGELNRSMGDSLTIRSRNEAGTQGYANQIDNLRNRLENLRTSQTASVKGANLDNQQQINMIENVEARYRELSAVLSSLESRKGMPVMAKDAQEADNLARAITRLNTQLSSLVTESSKANRFGLDDRFAKEARSMNDFMEATELARTRSMAGVSFLARDNETVLQQINASTQRERQRYQDIMARSAEMGAGESIKALRRLHEDTRRETVAINETMERLSLEGAVRRRKLMTENISPEDFATGVLQRSVEGDNEMLKKLASTFFSLEEAVNRGTTRWNAFLNVLSRGKTIIDYYLAPLYTLQRIFGGMKSDGAQRAVRSVGIEAEKSTGIIRRMIDAIGAVTSGAGRAIAGGVSAAASGAMSLFRKKPQEDTGTAAGINAATGAADKLASSIDKANVPARGLLGTFKNIANQIWGADSMTARLGENIAQSLTNAFKVSFGFNFINIVSSAMNTVRGMIGEAFTIIGDQQATVTQFTSSISDELFRTGQAESLAAAEKEAAKQAEELFTWTEKLAILSPFGQDDISKIVRFLQVGGMLTDEMKEMTQVIIDAGTGLGLTNESTVLLSKAFSDVMVKGKLSGQEVLQFAAAGVPVMRQLSQLTGKSLTELNDFFSQGGILEAPEAIAAIADYLVKRTEGAAERASQTARGLANTLSDLKARVIREFSTPIFEQVFGPMMSGLAESLQSEELMANIRQMGETVADVMETIIYWIGFAFGLVQSAIEAVNPVILDFIKHTALFLATDTVWAILWSLAVPAVMALGAALSGLISWYGLYTVASAGLAIAWQRDWMGFRTIVTEVVSIALDFLGLLMGETKRAEGELSGSTNRWRSSFFSILDAIGQVSIGVMKVLPQLASDMISWGANLATSLADGFMSAMNSILDALFYLGDVMATWLMPGSPPKLLPDLTVWGKGAADAWLEGWTQADFTTLNSISDSVTTAFESIGENIDTTELGKINSAIAVAISSMGQTGTFDMGSVMVGLDDAVDRFDEVAEEIGRMVEAQLNAAAAESKLAKAQNELTAATEGYDAQLKSVNDEIATLDAQLNAMDVSSQQEELMAVTRNRFATEKQQTTAGLKVQKLAAEQRKSALDSEKERTTGIMQVKINALQKEVDKTQEVLGVTEARYKIEFDALKTLTEARTSSMNASASATDAAKKSQDRLNDAILAYKMQIADTPGKIALMKEELKKYDEGSVEYYETLTKIVQLEDQWKREQEQAAKKKDNGPLNIGIQAQEAGQKIEEAKGKIGGALDEIKNKVNTAMTDAKTAFTNAQNAWGEFTGAIESGINGEPIQSGATKVNTAVYGIGLSIGIVGVVWQGFKDGFSGTMPAPEASPVETWANTVGGYIGGIWDKAKEVLDNLKGFGQKIKDLLGPDTENGASLQTEVKAQLDLLFGEVSFGDMAESMTNFVTAVKDGFMGIVWPSLSDSFTGFKDAVVAGFTEFMAGIGDTIAAGMQLFSKVSSGEAGLGDAAEGVGGMLGGITSAVTGLINSLVGFLAAEFAKIDWMTAGGGIGFLTVNFIAAILDLFGKIKWNIVFSIVFGAASSFLTGLIGGIVAGIATIAWEEKFANVFGGLADAVTGAITGMATTVVNTLAFALNVPTVLLGLKMWELFAGMINSLAGKVNVAIGAINEWLPESLQLGVLPTLTIGLTSDNFTIVNPTSIDVSSAVKFSTEEAAKVLLDPKNAVTIGGEQKILVPAEILSLATDDISKLNLGPTDIIKINGEDGAKLVLDPSQVVKTKEGVFLQVDPSTIIKINTEAPIELSVPVQLTAELQSTVDEIASSVKAEVLPEVNESDKIQASDVVGETTVTFQPEMDWTLIDLALPADKTETVKTSGQNNIGVPLAQGVNAGYQTAIDGVQLSADTQTALDQITTDYSIKSPSQWTNDNIGVPLGEGVMYGFAAALLATDISDSIGQVMEKIKGMFSGATEGGDQSQDQAQGQASGIAQAVTGSLDGLDETVAEIFRNMNVAVNAVMATMTDDLITETEDYVEEGTDIIQDYYDWMIDETTDTKKDVTDLFSQMQTSVVTIVKDTVSKSTTEFGKIKDAFKASAKAAIDAAVQEFKDGAERMEAAIEGVIGEVSQNLLTKFEEQGKKLGKKIADGIVSAFKGSDGNNFITALASAIETAVNKAIENATRNVGAVAPPASGGGSTPTPTPTPTPPGGGLTPRSALQAVTAGTRGTVDNMLDIAKYLAPLQEAGLFGMNTSTSLAATTSPLTGGSTVIVTNNYNIYQTVTPEQAVRVDRNFKIFEAQNRR